MTSELLSASAREGGTVALAIMLSCSALFFGFYLNREFRLSRSARRFYDDPVHRAAIAWFWLCIGLSIKNAAAFALIRHGAGADAEVLLGFVHAASTMLAVWASVCLMRSLVGPGWPPRAWIWMALIAAGGRAVALSRIHI